MLTKAGAGVAQPTAKTAPGLAGSEVASVGVKAVLETVRGTVSGLNARSAGCFCPQSYRKVNARPRGQRSGICGGEGRPGNGPGDRFRPERAERRVLLYVDHCPRNPNQGQRPAWREAKRPPFGGRALSGQRGPDGSYGLRSSPYLFGRSLN